jgi:hypothetical protein
MKTENKSTAVGAFVGGLLALAGVLFGLDTNLEESAAIVAGSAALCAVIARRLSQPE